MNKDLLTLTNIQHIIHVTKTTFFYVENFMWCCLLHQCMLDVALQTPKGSITRTRSETHFGIL